MFGESLEGKDSSIKGFHRLTASWACEALGLNGLLNVIEFLPRPIRRMDCGRNFGIIFTFLHLYQKIVLEFRNSHSHHVGLSSVETAVRTA